MEWLKKQNLKQSFMAITCLFLCVGILLAAVSTFICVQIRSEYIDMQTFHVTLDNEGEIASHMTPGGGELQTGVDAVLSILQIVLPIFWVVASLLLADVVFYNIKLKRPLAILQAGAARIQRQDLDFEVEQLSPDELGQLCASFEIMRQELKKNNQELWRQSEERKRLNAAFSHDLRNPITVLKGSAKMLQKETEQIGSERINSSVSLISQYTGRIENYVEMMSSAQKLEELECCPATRDRDAFQAEFASGIEFLATSCEKNLVVSNAGTVPQVQIDKELFLRIAENLVSNALRYAKENVSVHIDYCADHLTLSVVDDGPGFSAVLLEKGPAPFQRDDVAGDEHFGMGLYICKLLCEKHGGGLMLENTPQGTKATAIIKYLKP